MSYWNPAQYLDPLGAALGGGMAGGLVNFAGGYAQNRDQDAFAKWVANQQGTRPSEAALISPDLGNFGMGQIPREQSPLPNFLSGPWRDMARNVAGQQMQNMMPLGPMDRAKLGLLNAQTEAERRGPGAAGPIVEGPNGTLMQQDRYGKWSVVYKDLTPEEQKLQDLEIKTRTQVLEDMSRKAKGEMTPKQQKAINRATVQSRKIDALQKKADHEKSPLVKQHLQAQIDKLTEEFEPPVRQETDGVFVKGTVTQKRPDGSVEILQSPEGRWSDVKVAAKGGRLPDGASYQVGPKGEVRILSKPSSGFSQSYIKQVMGELTTGAPSSILGIPMEALRTQKDAAKHAINKLGPYDGSPEWEQAMAIIRTKPEE